ncbi:uncharacterized protein BDR25DRAFT_358951 [Lindgomyces ingoldianus]|uniref:Uncharacterized protein n=1 Tax=Lindgomyces ingoldianus TaxID=673940 RepID=A0ACB6QIQ1_9PLEO|nr:uncharacterized protein BDR25DRAFT_358951 [Lindgomyces ingoldianus]KAF2466889.1 hypothetical protein BDR25DRAFT_358951 [Lindgomyces ingoldianus]
MTPSLSNVFFRIPLPTEHVTTQQKTCTDDSKIDRRGFLRVPLSLHVVEGGRGSPSILRLLHSAKNSHGHWGMKEEENSPSADFPTSKYHGYVTTIQPLSTLGFFTLSLSRYTPYPAFPLCAFCFLLDTSHNKFRFSLIVNLTCLLTCLTFRLRICILSAQQLTFYIYFSNESMSQETSEDK